MRSRSQFTWILGLPGFRVVDMTSAGGPAASAICCEGAGLARPAVGVHPVTIVYH